MEWIFHKIWHERLNVFSLTVILYLKRTYLGSDNLRRHLKQLSLARF